MSDRLYHAECGFEPQDDDRVRLWYTAANDAEVERWRDTVAHFGGTVLTVTPDADGTTECICEVTVAVARRAFGYDADSLVDAALIPED